MEVGIIVTLIRWAREVAVPMPQASYQTQTRLMTLWSESGTAQASLLYQAAIKAFMKHNKPLKLLRIAFLPTIHPSFSPVMSSFLS